MEAGEGLAGAGFPPGVGQYSCWYGRFAGPGDRGGEGGACGGRARPAGAPQSQPLSFTMCDISMMYFPSLYFWLVSKACS